MMKTSIIVVLSFLLLFPVFSLSAENPVCYVMEISGSYSCADSQGVKPLELKSGIFNDSVITRSSASGYIKLIDRDGRITPNLVEARIDINGRKEIEPAKQKIFLAYIGGTMARSGKGASSNDFLDWMTDLGTVMEQDVEAKGMALVFSNSSSSFQSRIFIPLVLKVNDRYRIEKITYKVVQSTLVRAEGVFTKQGDNFVLPLKEIDYQADETIPLHLTIVALDTITKKVKTFNMEAPFRILADDGFIEHEISKTTSLLSQGSDNPDTEILGRMAKLSVYSDYGMNIYSLALWAVK